jgi:hypothetical protein
MKAPSSVWKVCRLFRVKTDVSVEECPTASDGKNGAYLCQRIALCKVGTNRQLLLSAWAGKKETPPLTIGKNIRMSSGAAAMMDASSPVISTE